MPDNLFLLLTMSALKFYKFQARTFLEIYNQLWLMGPCFKSYLSYKFDLPEAIRNRAKTNEFLRSLCPETLRKLFGALDASEKFSYSSLYHIFKIKLLDFLCYEN